jgi:hypothetical protein
MGASMAEAGSIAPRSLTGKKPFRIMPGGACGKHSDRQVLSGIVGFTDEIQCILNRFIPKLRVHCGKTVFIGDKSKNSSSGRNIYLLRTIPAG